MAEWLRATGQGSEIDVLVVPRASRSELSGIHQGRLRIRIAAPPVEGKANQALTRYVAKLVGVSRSRVTIASGQGGRRKVVSVVGVTPETVKDQLEKALGESL